MGRGKPNRRRTSAAPTVSVLTTQGVAELATDPRDPAVRVLRIEGLEAAAIDLADPAHPVTTLAGSGALAFTDGAAASAAFRHPHDVGADAAGNLYVADYDNHVIRKLTRDAGGAFTVSTLAGDGTAGWALRGRRLHKLWSNGTGGTSPVIAGGLAFIHDPNGALNVYRPDSGKRVARLQAGSAHWNSPVIADRHVWLPEGDANDHATSGTLSIYSLP